MGTSTRKDLHVLCYQHHKEMLLGLVSEPAEGVLYACQEPGCLIRYDAARGYFLDTEDLKTKVANHLASSSSQAISQSLFDDILQWKLRRQIGRQKTIPRKAAFACGNVRHATRVAIMRRHQTGLEKRWALKACV